MGLFTFVKDAGEKLWDSVTGNHDSQTLSKKVADHLSSAGIPEADKVTVNVVDGQATVSGSGLSQEAKEKLLVAVGNIAGIAKVEDEVIANDTPTPSRFYTVKSGDTLSAIAKSMYGNANEYQKIFSANQPMLKSPDKIYPGQTLRIPE